MSLNVYLIGEEKRVECTCECGHKHSKMERETLYDSNITHNLNKMADEAGIYEALWRPEEIGAEKAKDIIGKLGLGLDLMKKDPEHFKIFDASNGWGKYEDFVPWVEKYLNACIENPEATIEVSR
jgi:hypothetical protein